MTQTKILIKKKFKNVSHQVPVLPNEKLKEKLEEGTTLFIESLQYPILNKQVSAIIENFGKLFLIILKNFINSVELLFV